MIKLRYLRFFGFFINPNKALRVFQLFANRPYLAKYSKLTSSGVFEHPALAKNKRRWHRMVMRYTFIAKHIKNCDVLEVCAGSGWGAFLISDYAKTYVASDILDFLPKLHQELHPSSKVKYGTFDALERQQELIDSFDVILLIEGIEHFTKECGKKLLENIHSYLRAGGTIYITSEFPETSEQAAILCDKVDDHLYIWTKDELRQVAHDLDMEVEYLDKIYCILKKC